jgi:archaeal flagellar protein FlaI
MTQLKQHLTQLFKEKRDINKEVNTLLNTKYRTLIKKKADELETKLLPKQEPSKKLIYQEEIAHMRKQLAKDKTTINITYAVNPPFAFVHIYFDKEIGEFKYLIKEPKLNIEEQKKLDIIKKKLEETMDAEDLPIEEKTMFNRSAQLRTYLYNRFEYITQLYDIEIPLKRKSVLFYFLESELLGLGRSDAILKDPYVEDVGCNGPHTPLYLFHRVYGSMKTNVIYPKELELNKFIFKLAQISGKHISVYQPILDAVLADGSRINLTLGSEVTRKGSTFTIRKFSYDPISPIDLLRFGTLSPLQLAYFWMLIEHKKSILLSGGTASGKTTMLNALCMFIRPEDKIVSIEDTPEIHIDHENWIQSVARKGYGKMTGLSGISAVSGISGVGGMGGSAGDVDLFDLLVAALRQRPEYVIVGEIRGREAFTLFQAIAVGHSSMSTVHAGSIDELLHRIESQPMNIPRVLFSSIDAVAFVGQVNYEGKRVRRIKNLVEVLEIEPETCNLLTNKAFIWHPKNDFFHFNGRSFILEKIGQEIGKNIDGVMHELHQKEQYIKLMDKKDIINYKDVSRAINQYYVDPVQAAVNLQKR